MDKLDAARRSENMRRIKSKDTKPEIAVRRAVHALGFRFRLHRKELPGKPDLVLTRHRKVILVHGCFWHSHRDPDCKDGRLPKSRLDYWLPKLARNKSRDAAAIRKLKRMGWSVLTVWECECAHPDKLEYRLRLFLRS